MPRSNVKEAEACTPKGLETPEKALEERIRSSPAELTRMGEPGYMTEQQIVMALWGHVDGFS